MTGSRLAGDGVIFAILVAASFYMWWRAQQQKVDHSNVNADWDESTNSVVPAEVRDARAANMNRSCPGTANRRLRSEGDAPMHYMESIFKVLIVGLVLGAGLPALFATGMLAYSFGAGGEEADHLIHKPNPPLKFVGFCCSSLSLSSSSPRWRGSPGRRSSITSASTCFRCSEEVR